MDKYFQSGKIRTKNAYNIMRQMIADYIHGMAYASTGCIIIHAPPFQFLNLKEPNIPKGIH